MKQMLTEFYLFIYILCLVNYTHQYKELKLEYGDLCSEITKRKIKLGKEEKSAVIVKQSRLYDHTIEWNVNFFCKFEVSSASTKNGGVIAVIQYLNFRKDLVSDECIDYIQFRTRDETLSKKFCGIINATVTMNKPHIDPLKQLVYGNSIIDYKGELDVYINISKKPLEYKEAMDLNIVFTSYKQCSKSTGNDLKPCNDEFKTFCIYKGFFNDDVVNCPYAGCTDEDGCVEQLENSKQSIGNKVLVGSISALFVMFGLFILCIWACRRHRIFCWSDDFAHPTPTPEEESNSNRTSRVIELNEQTGARLAVAPGSNVATAPPIEEDKDLPPSYDSLFPTPR